LSFGLHEGANFLAAFRANVNLNPELMRRLANYGQRDISNSELLLKNVIPARTNLEIVFRNDNVYPLIVGKLHIKAEI